jgi:hypothetical protein
VILDAIEKYLGVIYFGAAKVSDGGCINKKCPQLVGRHFYFTR